MVRLRQIPRTAAFAWSPGRSSPFIATGTRAGAVDADFSNETFLELWDLKLDGEITGAELQPAARISTDSRFHDLAWAETDDTSRGLIAGALENGSLDLWDAGKLLDGSSTAPSMKVTAHSGAVKALQFHPKHANLLASGGSLGELFITDLHNIDSPTRLGKGAGSQVEIDCLDWNKKVPHILATGSSDGFVTVWDAKAGKESLALKNLGRKPVSAIAWDPEKPTRLVTSIPLESDPVILVWDLRNANAPERIMKGHESGVLSLSWCRQDPRLLLSSGEDNRNICWDTQTGTAFGEFPIVTSATFQTRWNPCNPNILATASLDGKISVQTLQNTNPPSAQKGDDAHPLNDEDFFAKAQTQPQGPSFSLPKAPRWLERPATVNFGFGGRVVSVVTKPDTRTSTIRISKFEVDASIGAATDAFEAALVSGDLRNLCESRAADAETEEEKADWRVMSTLMSENPRKELVAHLGFSGDVEETADSLSKLGLNKEEETQGVEKPALAPPSAAARKHKRLTSIFDSSAESDSFLSDLSASKDAKMNSPFQLFTEEDNEVDKTITKALIQGNFDKALTLCLQEDRMADALMIAFSGGQKCIEKAQEAYFLNKAKGPSYIRLLASIAGKDIWDVVHNADLQNWKEIVAMICTFADDKEYPDLCEALGDRLEEYSRSHNSKETRKDASLCYLASSKLDKVVSIWTQELQENENKKIEDATNETGFSIHVQVLRDFIEKVTIFRSVTKFEDSERQKPSDWKLSSLYDKYIEYAEIVATHGKLNVAEKYLSLLPEGHPAGGVAKNRIQLATKKVTTKAAPKAATAHIPAATQGPSPVARPLGPGYPYPAPQDQQKPPMVNRGPAPNNPYAPSAFSQTSNPYAPAQTSNYSPAGYQPPSQPTTMPVPPYGGAHNVPPPPRGLTQSPSVAKSHTQQTNVPAWNDLPEGFARTPTPRRGTPGLGSSVISSPFPNQPQVQSPPQPGPPPPGPTGPPGPPGPPIQGHRGSMPVAPPPKGPFSPPQPTPGFTGTSQFVPPERPSSTANLYAPPPMAGPPSAQMGGPPNIARSASPYSPPPAGPPPQNRYAPAPSAQPAHQAGPPGPPQQAPGPGPYGPQRFSSGPPPPSQGPPPQGPYAPHGGQFTQPPPPPPPPHTGAPPRQDSRPSTGQSQKKAPVPPKHPAGDRSHIPDNAKPIFEILSADMQRVKSRAPSTFKAQVNDTERRLNILFDHLNNEDLLKAGTINSMVELSRAIQSRDYETAHAIHLDILTNRTDECGNWMVGVKRLIGMSKATP